MTSVRERERERLRFILRSNIVTILRILEIKFCLYLHMLFDLCDEIDIHNITVDLEFYFKPVEN